MEEDYSTNKPPLFKGIKYGYLKERMIAHFESMNINMWDVVGNGDQIPIDEELNEIPKSQWKDEQKQ